ncbi:MAG: Stage V sporulation protein D [Candidatus Cloacimonetes bacterium ADurb.Bin211]|nr:MAG: Stage V sporulation protein D [Candidatus Cloacimonetes bacterium ADurb.Bin211]
MKNLYLNIFRIVLVILILLLVGMLFNLQVVKGTYYQSIAESNFIRIRRIPATRGEIYDCKYRPIVTNIPSYNLYLTSGKISNMDALSSFLAYNFSIDAEELHKMVFEQRFKTYEEILILDNIPYEMVIKLSEKISNFPELSFRSGTTRNYLYPNHFTGYVGRIDAKEYERYKDEDYSLNSYIGKNGLERFYEVLLRGKDGKEIIQVDAQGRSLEIFKDNISLPPQNGLSLILTIDNDLQSYANEIFPTGAKGCIVVTDIKTGGILAYVSKPDYDPNIFMQKISPEVWASLNIPEKPLLDRVINATYPPGSVFKPIVGTLGLEKKVIDRNTHLTPCRGGLKIGNRFFRCWYAPGHGSLSIVDAFKFSCDVFFYDLINHMELDDVYAHTKACGLTEKTGIDLPNERSGFFPDTKYYKKKIGRVTGLSGFKANLAIGQGEVLSTPLEINTFFAAIARGGIWLQPHLLNRTMGAARINREQIEPLKSYRLPWSASTQQILKEGLWAVTNAPGGTARAINVPGATTYGKTGSAENYMGKLTHAWFAGFIETDKPEIVVTVFLENAGGGGAVAAPLANKIFNYYMGNIERIKKPAPIPPQFLTAEEQESEPEMEMETPAATETSVPPIESPIIENNPESNP